MNAKLMTAFENQYHVKAVQNYYESNPLMPRFQKPPYDPKGKDTAAYQWADTGIVYNRQKLGKQPPSWSILFDPEVNRSSPFAIGRDAQVMIGAACAYQGAGYACRGRDNWPRAAKLLLATKKRANFSGFENGTPVLRQLARGNSVAGVSFNSDYLQYKADSPSVFKRMKFVVPEQGAERWVDAMAIPDKAPHAKLANQFINFILNAKNGAALSAYTFYASPNRAAQPYLKPALKGPPSQPTAAQMKRLHYKRAVKGDSLQFIQQLWNEVQSR